VKSPSSPNSRLRRLRRDDSLGAVREHRSEVDDLIYPDYLCWKASSKREAIQLNAVSSGWSIDCWWKRRPSWLPWASLRFALFPVTPLDCKVASTAPKPGTRRRWPSVAPGTESSPSAARAITDVALDDPFTNPPARRIIDEERLLSSTTNQQLTPGQTDTFSTPKAGAE